MCIFILCYKIKIVIDNGLVRYSVRMKKQNNINYDKLCLKEVYNHLKILLFLHSVLLIFQSLSVSASSINKSSVS